MTDDAASTMESQHDFPMMCAYCRIYPAVEWSDQGRAQCERCSPP